jgi:hypothetical protein
VQGHATGSTTIVANNREIIRVVGTNGKYGAGSANGVQVAETGFVRFNYDNYTDNLPLAQQAHIVVRGVTLLDYTPGGPDLANQPGPLVAGDIGGTPLAANAGYGIAAGTLQRGSEIHGESGDAFIYGGPADDIIYGGDSGNDTIITGYGDNWVSGGRGDSCIIGGGGRCFVSRVGVPNGEPLYGVAPTPAANISQLITTPGNAQEAVINVAGALQYVAELFPYNWDPNSAGGTIPTYATESNCKPNKICRATATTSSTAAGATASSTAGRASRPCPEPRRRSSATPTTSTCQGSWRAIRPWAITCSTRCRSRPTSITRSTPATRPAGCRPRIRPTATRAAASTSASRSTSIPRTRGGRSS